MFPDKQNPSKKFEMPVYSSAKSERYLHFANQNNQNWEKFPYRERILAIRSNVAGFQARLSAHFSKMNSNAKSCLVDACTLRQRTSKATYSAC